MMTNPDVLQVPVSGVTGYIRSWKPRKGTKVMIQQIQDIMANWEGEGVTPVKNRTLFYRMGVLHGYPKTESFYKNTINPVLTKMRRCDPDCLPDLWLDWKLLIDDGATPPAAWFYTDPAQFWKTMEAMADRYKTDPLRGQGRHFIVWLEAGGLVAAAMQGASLYGVPVATGGKQDSYYMKRKAAEWIAKQGVTVTVFHIGDYDGQGIEIFNNIAADVPALVSEIGDVEVEFIRLGVLSSHVAPGGQLRSSVRDPKATPADIRQGFNEKGSRRVLHAACEAEAFDPVDIRTMVKDAIEGCIDMDIFEQTVRKMALERTEIQQVVKDRIAADSNIENPETETPV